MLAGGEDTLTAERPQAFDSERIESVSSATDVDDLSKAFDVVMTETPIAGVDCVEFRGTTRSPWLLAAMAISSSSL